MQRKCGISKSFKTRAPVLQDARGRTRIDPDALRLRECPITTPRTVRDNKRGLQEGSDGCHQLTGYRTFTERNRTRAELIRPTKPCSQDVPERTRIDPDAPHLQKTYESTSIQFGKKNEVQRWAGRLGRTITKLTYRTAKSANHHRRHHTYVDDSDNRNDGRIWHYGERAMKQKP